MKVYRFATKDKGIVKTDVDWIPFNSLEEAIEILKKH